MPENSGCWITPQRGILNQARAGMVRVRGGHDISQASVCVMLYTSIDPAQA